MKIHPVGAVVLYTWTDRLEAGSRFSQFCERA